MILLLLLAELLKIICWFPMFFYGMFRVRNRKQWYKNLAVSKDQYGNVLGMYLFNDLLIIKKAKHRFGSPDETISSVLGKNKKDGTLTKTGAILSNVLDFLDTNHSIKSIEHDERNI
jgi:hypothetical protein